MNIDRLTINDSAAAHQGYDRSSSFDFRTAFRVLKRRSRTVIAVTVACLGLGVGAALIADKSYESGTSVLLEAPALNPFGREQVYSGPKFDNVTIESQMQVIRSPLLLSQVVETLDLEDRPLFWAPEPGRFGTRVEELKSNLAEALRPPASARRGAPDGVLGTLSAFGLQMRSMLAERLEPADDAVELSDAERFRNAVEKLRDDVSVSRNGVTSVLAIKASANSPELAAEIANEVAQAYVMQRYDMRRASATTAAGWFETRMEELSQQAAAAEGELSAASGLGNADTGAARSAGTAAAMRDAISARLEAQARFDQTMLATRSNNPLGVLPASSASPAFAELSKAYSTTTDPDERADMNQQAKALLPGLLATAQTSLDEAIAAEKAARDQMDASAVARSEAQSDIGRLESEARIYREMYETYTTTYLRTKEQQTFPVVDATVLGVAQPPEAASGRSGSQLLFISGLLGLTLGSGLAFLRESADATLRTRAALSRAVGGPVLGLLPPLDEPGTLGTAAKPLTLPEISILRPRVDDLTALAAEGNAANLVPLPKHRLELETIPGQMSMTLTHPLSRYSDTVRRIRVAFDNHFSPRHAKRGSVIGFLSDEGTSTRSTLAMNYAEMIAVGGKKTLLIDFDWLEAFLSRAITPQAGLGMTDLLYSMSPNFEPDDVYWVDERSGLNFLPNRALSRSEPVDPATFDTAMLTRLVAMLSQRFDQIVIDFPSLADTVDAAGLSSVVDGFVCAADWGLSNRKTLARHMATSGIPSDKVIGAVLAGVTEERLAQYEATA